MTAWIFFGVALAAVLTWFRSGSDRFAPGRVFLVIWTTAIGLASLKLSYYQHEWSAYSWIVLLTGTAGFLAGVLAVNLSFVNRPRYSIAACRRAVAGTPINEELFFRAVVALCALYLLAYVLEVAIMGYIPLFAARPDRARIDFHVFGLHLLVNLMPVILLLVLEYVVISRSRRGRKWLVAAGGFLVALSFFLLLQRFYFVFWGLMALAFLYYASSILTFRRLLLLGSGFFGLLYVIKSFRVAIYVQNYIHVVSRMKYSVDYAAFSEPYMYIVMNFENFARSVERLEHFTLGYFTGDFLFAMVGLKHPLAEYFQIVDRPFLISGYNTTPFLWTYYYDFGIPGVFLIPLIVGAVIAYVYHRVRTHPSLFTAGLYSIAFGIMALMFFTNLLTMLNTFINIAVWLVIHRLVVRPAPVREGAGAA